MEPFAIHCTTCRARLVVRDLAAIGQILACPRCASMVLVEPPQGGVTPNSAAASPPQQVVRPRDAQPRAALSDALGIADTVPDAFSDLDELLADRAANVDAATTPLPATSSSRADPPAPPSTEPPARGREASDDRASRADRSAVVEAAKAAEMSGGVDDHAAPLPASALAHVARWSPATIVVSGGVLGVVLAVSAALLLILGFGRGRGPVAGTSNGDATTSDGQGSVEGNERSDHPTAAPDDSPGTADDQPATAGKSSDPAAPPIKPTPLSPLGKPDEAANAPGEHRQPEGDADPVPAPKPAVQGPDQGKGKSPSSASPEFTPRPGELRRPLPALGGKFADVLNNAPLDPAPRTDNADAPKPPDDPREAGGDAREKPGDPAGGRSALPRPLARDVDLTARLADPLVSVSYQSVPLLDFVAEVSDLSTIPITIDLNALRLRQLSVAAPITVKVEASTVEQLLAAALAPHQLVATAETGAQLVITLPRDDANVRKANYPIDDLTGGEADRIEQLIGLLTSFAAPDSWTAAGGEATMEAAAGQLTIEGPEVTHLEVVFLLEKIRAAQKLKPLAKPPFPSSWIGLDAVRSRAAEKLAMPLKLNFGRPTRLVTILQRLSRDTGTRIVANWQSLATIGWTTETQATVTVDGKSLDETLIALLEPMELTYRVVDDVTLEILTRQTATAMLDVEFHSAADLVQGDADALLRRIEGEFGGERFAASGGTALLRFDPSTKCLVAAAPYELQRRLSQVLVAWRAEASREK